MASILKGRKSDQRWGYREIEQAVAKLYDDGYIMRRWSEGTLGCGCFLMEPPDPEHMYYFVIEEHYANEWSSYHTCNRRRKSMIPDEIWDLIDKYDAYTYQHG